MKVRISLSKKFSKFYLFCLLWLSYSNSSNAAQEQIFTITLENVMYSQFFLEIEKLSDYSFVYNTDDINKLGKRNFYYVDTKLEFILDECLKENGYVWQLEDKHIIIVKKSQKQNVKSTKARGVVLDDKGTPIVGATVRIQGTTYGTTTNMDGKFELDIPDEMEIVLIFSFVGMKEEKVKFLGQKEIKLTMYEDIQALEDVVVTGYQVIDKRKLTSAISTIKAEDLDRMGVLTVDQMLEGKAPGLMVMNVSAQPGAATKMRVRSGNTFTGTREPLWVIDGVIYEDPVPLSAAEINSLDNVNLIGNAITGLNPQDIAQIDILKDASATAIYGTRAANGVIVVTTKRGKSGSLSLSYNGSLSIVERPRYSDLNLMNSKERIDVSREISQKNLYYPSTIFQYVGYEGALRKYYMREIDFTQFQQEVSRLETMNTDWFGELYRTALTHSHGVNLSGGTDKIRLYAGLNYDNQRGTEINVGLYRISGRINTDFDLRKNVLISLGLSGSSQKATYNHSAYSVFNEAYNMSRAIPAYDEQGNLYYVDKIFKANNTGDYHYAKYNILNELANSRRTVLNKDFNVRTSVDWEIIKGLKIRSQFSYRNTSNMTEEWIGAKTYYMATWRTYEDITDRDEEEMKKRARVPFGGIYSAGNTSQEAVSISTQINFNKSIAGHHHFNLNLGQEASSTSYDGAENWMAPGYNHEQGRSFIAIPDFYMTDDLSELKYPYMLQWFCDGSNGFNVYPTVTDRVSNFVSVFGILNYSYDDRYIFNFNIRSDGSNQFGQYQRYKFRPAWSTSVRWNIHSEPFLVGASSSFLDELALRFSYGFRGNPPSESPYLTIQRYGQSNPDVDPEYTSELASFPNANLKWERTKTVNVGLNHSWLGGRISGALDYSYSKSVDLLLTRPVSLVNGSSYQVYNGGSKNDHTFELNLLTQNIKSKDFQWNMNFNITRIKERILRGSKEDVELGSVVDFLNGSIYLKDFPIDGFYSYRFAGLSEEGLPTFEGFETEESLVNRDEYWDTRTIYAQLKKALIYEGSRLPSFYGGFGTEFRYKNITLSANFTYKIGQRVRLLEMYNGSQTMPMPEQNMSGEFNNRWRKPGDEAHTNIPGLSNAALMPSQTVTEKVSYHILPWNYSYWWAYDQSNVRTAKGSYIRWQTLTLNYTISNRYVKRLGASNVRLGIQIQNLGVLNFDKKLKGKDPEQVRSVGMPLLPSYNFNLSFSF
ncbi:MAG: SusC/RagA family TonB-linked outer membrane protein [Odoribacter splanchnicus]